MRRRDVLQAGLAAGGLSAGVGLNQTAHAKSPEEARKNWQVETQTGVFWPDGIRLPISLSLMFESGAQPRFNAPTPFNNFVPPDGFYDMPTISWYRYGVTEGIPRALEMLSRLKILMTSHMSGLAVEMYPDTAKAIVQSGHEAAAHGWDWSTQSTMNDEQEKAFIQKNVDIIMKVTGQRALGYNAPGLRGSKNIIQNLLALGFRYHIDDVSRDEPFIVEIDKSRELAVVPYAVYMNDIRAYEGRNLANDDFLRMMKRSFDRLYKEAGSKRRMMAITMHDRLLRPEHVETIEEVLRYMQQKQGVAFMKKIDIADYITKTPETIREPIGSVYPTIPGLYRG
jgi:peptidoglycan/xylan/chitin deacetylase (PgdA/CDA1 family)